MALLDDDDDLLAGFKEDKPDPSMKAVQAVLKRKQQRDSAKQATVEKIKQVELDLQEALENLNDEGVMLAEQQQMEEMKAKVTEELDKGDEEAGGPEPPVYAQALFPVQALPDLQLANLPEIQAILQQQQQLLGLSADSSSSSSNPQQLFASTFEWLLSEGLGLEICPSAAVAQAAFRAVCYGSSNLALSAYNRFMSWCGEPEVVAGCELMGLSQLTQWSGGIPNRPIGTSLAQGTALSDSMPPVTIQWLPSAADVLKALSAMGFQQQQQQQQQREECAEGQAYRHGNLPLLLQLLGRIGRSVAAGRLEAPGLAGNVQQYLQLVLALMSLMLDERAVLSCRCGLGEAFAALLALPADSIWDRLVRDTAAGSLLHALSGGLGPSHRSAVLLLGQMPRSPRGTALRQLGAIQLMAKLIPKAKAQVPPARISSMNPQQLRPHLHKEVCTLLGPEEKIRVLITSMSDPPAPGQAQGRPKVWLLTSMLEAADLVFWVDISTPGVGISYELREWLLQYLSAFDRVLNKRLNTHRVRNQVAGMENAYRFAELGCVVAKGE